MDRQEQTGLAEMCVARLMGKSSEVRANLLQVMPKMSVSLNSGCRQSSIAGDLLILGAVKLGLL